MLRILLVSALPPPKHGGIANWVRVVRRELDKRSDIQFHGIALNRSHEVVLGMPHLSRIFAGTAVAIRVIYQVFHYLRKNRPDVLHLNTSGGYGVIRDLFILYLARWHKVPTVAHFHLQRPPAEIAERSLYWKLLRWEMSLADTVVVLDKRSQARVRAALPDKNIALLPTMVEMDVIDSISPQPCHAPAGSESTLKLVFVGYVVPVKGVRELVQACSQIANRPMILDVVGKFLDASLQKELETLAGKGGTADWLHFHGNVDHAAVIQYILAADILVLPSHAESAPAVVIEAMGCGKPVVSTTTGAIPEMLDIGGAEECGICVPPRDVEALAAAIRYLADNPELRKSFGVKARRRAENFYSLPVGCKQLVDVWNSVAK